MRVKERRTKCTILPNSGTTSPLLLAQKRRHGVGKGMISSGAVREFPHRCDNTRLWVVRGEWEWKAWTENARGRTLTERVSRNSRFGLRELVRTHPISCARSVSGHPESSHPTRERASRPPHMTPGCDEGSLPDDITNLEHRLRVDSKRRYEF